MSLHVTLKDPTSTYDINYLYNNNITHNLGEMANKANIYEALWRPYRLIEGYNISEGDDVELAFEDRVIIKAEDIIGIIEIGLTNLKERPEYFEQFNSPNGWGMYEHFVPFVEEYLEALKKYPNAIVEIDR